MTEKTTNLFPVTWGAALPLRGEIGRCPRKASKCFALCVAQPKETSP